MARSIKGWFAVIAAMAVIAGGLGYYKTAEITAAIQAGSARQEPAEAVVIARARQGEWTATTRAIGTVVALRQLELRNEIAGTVEKLGFSSGDVVEAGQLLVQFDVRAEQASLEASEAELRLAKINFDRRGSLKSSPAFSEQEFDKAREDYAAANARATNLKVAIDKKTIVAPFRARVGITNLQPGAYLDVGTLIVRLQGVDDNAFIDFALPQDSAAMLKMGDRVTLKAFGLADGTASAEITAEDDSIEAGSRTVRFRATGKMLGRTLRPGSFVDVVAVTSTPKTAVFVPLSAIRRSPNGQHVFVVEEQDGKRRARLRPVETGTIQDGDIAIEKGLEAGEVVATSGSFKLRDGMLLAATDPLPANDAAGAGQ